MSPRLLLAALLALPAAAGDQKALPAAMSLPPLLLGRYGDPVSPLRERMDLMALDLLSRESRGSLDAARAARELERAEITADPLGRAAALSLARLLAEPGLRSRLEAEGAPVAPSVARLDVWLEAGQAYRGGPAERAAALARLVRHARKDPDLDGVFDNAAPDLKLGALYFKGDTLVAEGTEGSRPLARGPRSLIYAHPHVEGAVLERFADPVEQPPYSVSLKPRDGAAQREARGAESLANTLSAAGAGPRHFGLGVVAEGRLRPPLSHVVAVQERVYGTSVQGLILDRAFGPEERKDVEDLAWNLADAGVAPRLTPETIILGRTAVEPERRAWAVGVWGLLRTEPGLETWQRRWDIMNASVNTELLPEYADGRYLGHVRREDRLKILLDAGVAHSAPKTFKDKLRDALTDALNELARRWWQ